ncbi:Phosphoenolpyruvate-protein phosphotransferase [Thalassocella blandensis]|nr:Phosphoenolpyruvate-protein phosphotransferase [Thalassocella blandensis]
MNTISGETNIIRGFSISPGLAEGQIYLHRDIFDAKDSFSQTETYNADAEVDRLDRATLKITEDLLTLAARVEKEIDIQLAGVFGAHSAIVNDALLKEELRREIIENLVSAGSAVKSVFLRWEKRFLQMESIIAREKGEDFRDISIRLRNALANVTGHALENIPPGCILATQRLLPTDTLFLASRSTSGVLLEYGTMGSHAALFTRQMNVPCITGISNILNILPADGYALVDAQDSILTVNPDLQARTFFSARIKQYANDLKLAKKNSQLPSFTEDGIEVAVNANIGGKEDANIALEHGAQGIGLYRLEQFYIGRSVPPNKMELLEEMNETLSAFKGKPVCIRLLDIGSDKPLPFMGFLTEPNPALGRRGVRLMRQFPELLYTQLEAILCLVKDYTVQILIPMVTIPDDVLFVRKALTKLASQHDITPPQLGAMIETPAAALSASRIAPHVEFMSFGTNDLTQYAFAADRENIEVEDYYDDTSAVIFRLIELVHHDIPKMPLSICGELAGRQEAIAHLLKLGIRSLSVAAPLVPSVKETIRNTNLASKMV